MSETVSRFERLLLWWHGLQTRRKMNRVFSRKEDPFGYRSATYETARLGAMEEAAAGGRYELALEVGCAEGDFTQRLLGAARRVTAVDISPVALARARSRLEGGRVDFVEADIRGWEPPPDLRYDLIVLADVLYYLDKPLVRERFEAVFPRIAGWASSSCRLILAHAAVEAELAHRRGFRERFERLGFRLVSERVVGAGLSAGPVGCLLSVLEKP